MKNSRLINLLGVILLLIPYVLYVGFVLQANRGPVDYETFMAIGSRLIHGMDVYGENSYYPMPFVMIFALFSWLPTPSQHGDLAACAGSGSPGNHKGKSFCTAVCPLVWTFYRWAECDFWDGGTLGISEI